MNMFHVDRSRNLNKRFWLLFLCVRPMTICLRWCAGDDDVGGVVPVPVGPSAGNEAQEFGAVVPEGVFG